MMEGIANPRKYGRPPFDVVVVHGGPGAPGEMAPVARELSVTRGVLEPLQTANTLEGQVAELGSMIEKNADSPVLLIGWSWGAWLILIVASRFPWLVRKLILVSSGPFEEKYATNIMKTRLERLDDEEREEVLSIIEELNNPSESGKDEKMSGLGSLISKADSYLPFSYDDGVVQTSHDIYRRVWNEADELRSGGKLLEIASRVKCPVVAIHGDYDPHPSEGIRGPLSQILQDFRFILLENCGHKPWIEKMAKERFFNILDTEIGR
jgi:pimeloyl-ACP methyl ester carboxylesterase